MKASWTLALALMGAASRGDDRIDIGTRRELFVDRFLVERLDGARLELHRPVPREVVFRFDHPWEGVYCGYFTVLKDGNTYRLYYRGLPADERGRADHSRGEVTCVAESDDGIHFRRPRLGLYEVRGTRENNVILAEHPACHNLSPLIDTRPGVPAEERYKALGGNRETGLIAFVSGDGILWRELRKEPVITGGAFDSQNVAFYSPAEKRYVCYFRIFEQGFRSIARTTSEDFLQWTDPVPMTYGDTPREHLYTNQTHPYFRAPHIYISFPKRFHPGRRAVAVDDSVRDGVASAYRNDCSDGVFMTARGGNRYDRTFMEAFFRPGRDPCNWFSRANMAALGVVQTGPDEMSIYYSQHYAQPTHHVRRCTLRLDGFASVRAPYAGGEVLTRPFRFSGDRLTLNLSTSAAGSVRVELQDPAGAPVPGFHLEDCPEIIGDSIEHEVTWKGGPDLSGLAGKPVRMRLALKDADVYAFRFPAAGSGRTAGPGGSQAAGPEDEEGTDAAIVEHRRIWNQAPHSAFTDLTLFRGAWYCVFREAKGHVSPAGKIRVITSKDGTAWESAALLEREGSDLRDPKIEITPQGQLMILGALSWHEKDAPVCRRPMVWFSRDGRDWTEGVEVGEADYWLWRVTWHKGTAWGIGYGCGKERGIRLYRSDDGIDYRTVVGRLFDAGYPNETAIRFVDGDRALCLLRRDGSPNTGVLGQADPPYTEWTWKDLGTRIGGPNMIRLPDGRMVASVRLYDRRTRTGLCWIDPDAGTINEFLTLPSGGDTSYPGLVFHDGLLWVSYYSSHEGKTSIYLAKVRLPRASR